MAARQAHHAIHATAHVVLSPAHIATQVIGWDDAEAEAAALLARMMCDASNPRAEAETPLALARVALFQPMLGAQPMRRAMVRSPEPMAHIAVPKSPRATRTHVGAPLHSPFSWLIPRCKRLAQPAPWKRCSPNGTPSACFRKRARRPPTPWNRTFRPPSWARMSSPCWRCVR